jgi:magnesium-transporting ATPase (P-type)
MSYEDDIKSSLRDLRGFSAGALAALEKACDNPHYRVAESRKVAIVRALITRGLITSASGDGKLDIPLAVQEVVRARSY